MEGTMPYRKSYKIPDLAKREEDEVTRNVKPAPKAKPPRDDRRRRTIKEDDPDLDSKDKDLSLNYKDVGGSAKSRPWVIVNPNENRASYLVYDNDLDPHYFDTEDEAEEWVSKDRKAAEDAEEAKRQKAQDRRTEKDEKRKTPFKVFPPTAKRNNFLVFTREGEAKTFKKLSEAEEYAEEIEDKDAETNSKRQREMKIQKRKKEDSEKPSYVMDEQTLENIRGLQQMSSSLPPGLVEWLGEPSTKPPMDLLKEHYAQMDSGQLAQARASLPSVFAFLNYADIDEDASTPNLSAEDSSKIMESMQIEISKRETQIAEAPVITNAKEMREYMDKYSPEDFILVVKRQDMEGLEDMNKLLRNMSVQEDSEFKEKSRSYLQKADRHLINQSFTSSTSIDCALRSLSKESLINPAEYDLSNPEDLDEFLEGIDALSDSDIIEAFKDIPVYGLVLGVDGDTKEGSHSLRPEQRKILSEYLRQDIKRRAFFAEWGLNAPTPKRIESIRKKIESDSLTDKQKGLLSKYGGDFGSFFDQLFSILKRYNVRSQRNKTSRIVAAKYLGLPGPVDNPRSHMAPREAWQVRNTFELNFADALNLLRIALKWYVGSSAARHEETSRRRMCLDYAISTYQEGTIQAAVDAPTYQRLLIVWDAYLDDQI